jgi:hypothetical protein
MNKTEVIARRILGWKLNRYDRWYDAEKKYLFMIFSQMKALNTRYSLLSG